MAFCYKCNSEVGDYEKFCPYCGYPQQGRFGEEAGEKDEDFEIDGAIVDGDDIVRREIRTTSSSKAMILNVLFVIIFLAVAVIIYLYGR